MKDHLRDAWGFKGFVVSDCGAIVDVNQGHKKTPDITHSAALSLQAGTDLSCSIWTPGFNTLADAVHQGLVSEDLVTQAAERLYTARFQLGLFDPPGSSLDRIPFQSVASNPHRLISRKAAEESIVLLKNNGALPLKSAPGHIAVIGPTADQLTSILGNYVGTPLHPVTPLEGIQSQFRSSPILYAQGSTLAEGVGVPVPRTAFGLNKGLKTEFFATPDWTGRPVAIETEPAVQTDWENAKPMPQIDTFDYSVRWTGTLSVPAPGHYVFTLEPGDSFPYSPAESYRFVLDGKVLSEGSLRADMDMSAMGNFKAAPGASPTAPPIMKFPKPAEIAVDVSDTKPHQFELQYSHSGDRSGGGLTLKWQAPAQAQLDEAVARAKEADVVVAFVGLSPQLEGEEMRIKIPGFEGGDRTSLDLPEPQQKLLEAVAATGKPLIVVLQSGSAVALSWANEHAAAVLEAWYPGVEGGTAIARTLAGLNNPAGRLPVTFYASLDGLPAFTDYAIKGRTYRYFTGKPLWGFGYGLSYSKFTYGPVKFSAESVKAGDPITATVTVTNTGKVAGDEVVEAYLKTPQEGGPIHSLVGFERVTLDPGASKDVDHQDRPAVAVECGRPGQPVDTRRQIHPDRGWRATAGNGSKIGGRIQRHRHSAAAEMTQKYRAGEPTLFARAASSAQMRFALLGNHPISPLNQRDEDRRVAELRAPWIQIGLRDRAGSAAGAAGIDLHMPFCHLGHGLLERWPTHWHDSRGDRLSHERNSLAEQKDLHCMSGFAQREAMQERKGRLGGIVRPPGAFHHDVQWLVGRALTQGRCHPDKWQHQQLAEEGSPCHKTPHDTRCRSIALGRIRKDQLSRVTNITRFARFRGQ